MYVGYVVVNNRGPCTVPKDLFRKITEKKNTGEFGHAILFMLELDLERRVHLATAQDIEHVRTMEEFVTKFMSGGGAAGRSILIE